MIERILTFLIIGSGFMSFSFISWAYTRDFHGWPVWLLIGGLSFWLLAAILFSEHEKRDAHLRKLAERYKKTRAEGGIMHVNDNAPNESVKIDQSIKNVLTEGDNTPVKPLKIEDKKTNDR